MSRRAPHAIRRAAERYGVRLDLVDLMVIEGLCRSGAPLRLCAKGTPGVEAHIVDYRGKHLAVVYSRLSNRLITVLPPAVIDAGTGTFHRDWTLGRAEPAEASG